MPLADGGDGTLDVLLSVLKGKKISTQVEGPLGKKAQATWAMMNKTAVIEMARASGLALVSGKNRIMEATSIGTGELITAALNRGCKTIYLGVGGTACAEGGAGALRKLGLAYYGKAGEELSAQPVDLYRLAKVDWSRFDRRLAKTKIFVLCDVRNPLLGPHGSAHAFGPQKGATPAQVKTLEKMLTRWARFAKKDAKKIPGAGAAGALAFGLAGFARARLVEGTRFIMKTLKWRRAAKKADLIITGEGRLDKTSFSGKVIGEILRSSRGKKLLIVCGSSSLSQKQLRRKGVAWVEQMGKRGLKNPTVALEKSMEKSLKNWNFNE